MNSRLRLIFHWLLVVQISIGICVANEEEVIKYLKDASESILESQELINYFDWNFNDKTKLNDEQLHLYNDAIQEIDRISRDIFTKYHDKKFSNYELNRQIKSLTSSPIKALFIGDTNQELFHANVDKIITSLLNQKLSYKAEECDTEVCKMIELNSAERAEKILQIRNATLLKHYWEHYFANRNFPMEMFWQAVNFYKNEASSYSGGHPLVTWYREYLESDTSQEAQDFFDELSSVINQLRPLYQKLHAYIRQKLSAIHQDAKMTPRDQIPEHLMEQMLLQIETNEFISNLPEPENSFRNMSIALQQTDGNLRSILAIVNSTFALLGNDVMYKEFWHNGIKLIESPPAHACESKVLKSKNYISLILCNRHNYKGIVDSFEQMFEVLHVMNTQDLPNGLNREACPGFTDGIAHGLLLFQPRRYQKSFLQHRTFVQALALFKLYRHYIYETLWKDILQGSVEQSNFNCHYWKLQGEIAGIRPPVVRSNAIPDIPVDFIENIPPKGQNTKHLISFIVAFKFEEWFDTMFRRSGGLSLQHIMTRGYIKPWRKLDDVYGYFLKLNANNINGYFDDLSKWLDKENLKTLAPTGWDPKTYCVG